MGGGDEEETDRRWMRRALALARRGRGSTRPNPMVGAVVVRGGKLLGEGYHARAGEPHAEVNALAKVAKAGKPGKPGKPGNTTGRGPAAGATVYVNLEPCGHTGRTAPCADVLIAAGVSRVVIGVRDPNPLVDGRGIARLRRAGIRVDVGCLKDESRALNRPFFVWVSQGRPLVTLKAAVSLDGFIADGHVRRRAAPAWITGPASREAAHLLRAEHDAVLVGAGTVRADNPRLTARLPGRRGPRARRAPLLRVILDGRLAVPTAAAVLTPVAGAGTLVLGAVGASPARAAELRVAGAEVLLLPGKGRSMGRIEIGRVLQALAKRGVQSVLVEGGAEVHAAFIAAGLVDQIAFFQAPILLGGGVPVARGIGRAVSGALRLGPMTVRAIGGDLLITADVRI